MTNEEGKIVSVGTTSHAFLNTDGKPIRMKQEFPELYETLCGIVVGRSLWVWTRGMCVMKKVLCGVQESFVVLDGFIIRLEL